jgi:hypothetical protein
MRTISSFLILLMVLQAFWLPAQGISINVERVVKGPAGEFLSDMVISDDGTAFYIRNSEVLLNGGAATGIEVGEDFFGNGILSFFSSPALIYIDGQPRSVFVHGTVDGEDSLGAIDFAPLGPNPQVVDPRLVVLLFFTVLAFSLPSAEGTAYFQPFFRRLFD